MSDDYKSRYIIVIVPRSPYGIYETPQWFTNKTDQKGESQANKHWSLKPVVLVVVSHIQRIGCQPEIKLLYTVANPARGLLKRGGKKKKGLAAPPLPPPPARCSFGEN